MAAIAQRDYVGGVLQQARAAVGLFVSQNLEATVRKDSDPVEFFLAVLAALQLLGRTSDTVQHYRELVRVETRQPGQTQPDDWVGNWRLLEIVDNVVQQLYSVAIFLLARLVTDLTVATTDETGSTLVTTLVSCLVFVLIDALSKLRWRSPEHTSNPRATAEAHAEALRRRKLPALLRDPTAA